MNDKLPNIPDLMTEVVRHVRRLDGLMTRLDNGDQAQPWPDALLAADAAMLALWRVRKLIESHLPEIDADAHDVQG